MSWVCSNTLCWPWDIILSVCAIQHGHLAKIIFKILNESTRFPMVKAIIRFLALMSYLEPSNTMVVFTLITNLWNLSILAFWTVFRKSSGPNWLNFAVYDQYLDFWFQIYTKEWRVCKKGLVDSLKNSTWFFALWTNFGQSFGPKWPNLAF